MDKAEERALKCYPSLTDPFDRSKRLVYRNGYHQAEKDLGYNNGYMKAKKDLALTAEDVSCIIHLADQFGKDYQRIADVFNKDREEEQK